MMNDTMVEIGFDASKMPLGKLSKRTITQGYEVGRQCLPRVHLPLQPPSAFPHNVFQVQLLAKGSLRYH